MHQFLLGLDDARFGNVCTNIIGLDSLPDLNTVYQRVVREERRLASARVEPKQTAIWFAAKTDTQPTMESLIAPVARSRSSIVCGHCGRTSHEKKDCWQLNGFPEWITERNQGGARGRGTSARGRGGGRANQARSNAVQIGVSSSGFPNFTPEQWASLSAVLDQGKPTPVNNRQGRSY